MERQRGGYPWPQDKLQASALAPQAIDKTRMRQRRHSEGVDGRQPVINMLHQLGTREDRAAPSTTSGPTSTWQSSHIVIECWPKGTLRTDIDKQVQDLAAMTPLSVRDILVGPYGPKAYGRIAKVKV